MKNRTIYRLSQYANQQAARPSGSTILNNVQVSIMGTQMVLETQSGYINLPLTPQQVTQLQQQLPDLQGGSSSPGYA